MRDTSGRSHSQQRLFCWPVPSVRHAGVRTRRAVHQIAAARLRKGDSDFGEVVDTDGRRHSVCVSEDDREGCALQEDLETEEVYTAVGVPLGKK